MDRRTFLQLIGATIAAACTPTAAAPSASPSAPLASSSARGTAGRVAVYSSLDERTVNELIAAFGRAVPGVQITLFPLAATSELATRIRVERDAPKGDVLLGGATAFHDALGKEGLLNAYASANAGAQPSRDAGGLWTGWYTDLFGLATHRARLSAELAGTAPARWDDLLDPAWQGKLIVADPRRTEVGYAFVATQLFRFGRNEQDAMDYLKKLNANVARYSAVTEDAIALVGQGQAVASPGWAHDILMRRAAGDPIELIVPTRTSAEVGAVSMLKGAKDVAAARALIDWLLTRDAGQVLARLGRTSLRSDVDPPQGLPAVPTGAVVDSDWPWAADNKDRLLMLWQRTLGVSR